MVVFEKTLCDPGKGGGELFPLPPQLKLSKKIFYVAPKQTKHYETSKVRFSPLGISYFYTVKDTRFSWG